MSALEIVACVSWAAGVVASAGVVAAFWWRSQRQRVLPAESPAFNVEDRQVLADQFGDHVAAVRRQVRVYADQLADGDPELRERLRRIEGGLR